ncbi:MAG TPA: helix-turn-helix domain-containing protein [Dehalococcoidia bacterium]
MTEGYWLTVSAAAKFVGVSEPTLRKWTDSGRIGAFRTPGGHRRYLRAELEQFKTSRAEENLATSSERRNGAS